jgi:hypothetical protein
MRHSPLTVISAGLAIGVLAVVTTGAGTSRAAAPPSVDVQRVPHGGIQPEVATGRDGVIHLVYFTGTPAAGDLLYVSSADGGRTFSGPLRVNSQPGSAIATGTIRGAQIAVGSDGRVHVAWNGSDAALPRGVMNPKTQRAGSPMLYTRSNAKRTAFEGQRNLTTHTFDIDGGGSIATDEDGSVYVAWHANDVKGEPGEAVRRVWLARSADNGASFAPETAAWSEPTGACGCCGMRLLAAGQGQLHLLYRSASQQINRDVFALLSTDRGRTFTGARLHEWDINACPMTSMSLAVRGTRVLAAWETDGQVFFKDVAGSPAAAPQAPAGGSPETRRKHPRLAFAEDGSLLMVWTEGTAWNKGGSLAWQVYDAAGQPAGPAGARTGVATWSVGAVAARPAGGFVVFY